MTGNGPEEILIEWAEHGTARHVRAVDASDGLEVTFIAPVSASRAQLRGLAAAKLRYVRRRRNPGRGQS